MERLKQYNLANKPSDVHKQLLDILEYHNIQYPVPSNEFNSLL